MTSKIQNPNFRQQIPSNSTHFPSPNIPQNMNHNNIICSPMGLSCIPDWDEPFTDQQLLAIQAIEAAAYKSLTTTTTTTTTCSSLIKKRKSNSSPDLSLQDRPTTLRQLPNSILALCKPFSLSPCQDNLRMRYPAMRFGGQILYSRTAIEVDKAAAELLQILEAKKRETGQVTVGFDIEWRASFRRGVPPGKAAVMQICGDTDHCHVMHIIHSGIPRSLQFLLEDSTLLKVGVGIGNDAVKVFKDYNVSVKAVEDISCLANQKLDRDSQQWSLGSLTEMLVCKELQKPNKIRLGNWEVNLLSKEQLQYAATDAFASWHLYQVLKNLPDAVDKRSEELQGVSP